MHVVQPPPIRFTCTACKAVCEGGESEFKPLNTVPPTFMAPCAFCGYVNTCSPQALVVRAAVQVGNAFKEVS